MKRFIGSVGKIVGIVAGLIVGIGLGLFVLRPKAPQPPENLKTVNDVEAYFEQVVAAEHPPGLSVAVIKDEQIVYAKGFGLADGPSNTKASQDTVYHWWSMTKIPTAIAVMQLQERGQLDIDDPIRDYLPYIHLSYEGIEHARCFYSPGT